MELTTFEEWAQTQPETMVERAPWRNKPKMVILHHSASGDVDAAEVDRWHKEAGSFGVGYHYLIQFDGTCERGRAERQSGAHAGPEYNSRSLGVMLAGNFEEHKPTDAQMRRLKWLLEARMPEYGLGAHCLVKHRTKRATACPGKHFPMDKVRGWFVKAKRYEVRIESPVGKDVFHYYFMGVNANSQDEARERVEKALGDGEKVIGEPKWLSD